MSGSESQKENAIRKLLKLIDIKSAPPESTRIFSKKLHQQDIANATEYWFDQTKMFFAEPVSITHIHGLKEAGIDILIELMLSKIKFGIQIKAPSDFEDDADLYRHVKAQITDSHQHDLARIMVILAGDRAKYNERISGLISEFSRGDYNYVIVIPPEKMVTIYESYLEKKNPLKQILLDHESASFLVQGIVEALSNEQRSVKAEIKIDYENISGDSETKRKLTLKTDKPRIIDEIESLPFTGDLLQIDKPDFTVEGTTGIEFRTKGEDGEKLYVWSGREDINVIAIQIIDEQGRTIQSLGLQLFVTRKEGNLTHIETKEKNQPLGVDFIVAEDKSITIRYVIDDTKGDAVQLLEAMDFVNAVEPSRSFKIFHPKYDEHDILPIEIRPEKISQFRYRFVRSLAIIQKYSTKQMQLPKTVPSRESVAEIFETALIIEKGEIEVENVIVPFSKNEAIRLLDAYVNRQIAKTTTIQITQNRHILEKEIILKPTINLSKIRPKGELEELKKRITNTNQDIVEIEFEHEADYEPQTK